MPRRKNPYANCYTSWLLGENLPRIQDPEARLIEALLRRGFRSEALGERQLKLCLGAPSDLGYLKSLGSFGFVQSSADPHSLNFSAVYEYESVSPRLIESIILLPSWRGMSAIDHHRDTWREFRDMRHLSPQVSVAEVDLGLSLLVQALAVARVKTNMACDGHGHKAPALCFNGKYHQRWFLRLLEVFSDEVSGLGELQVRTNQNPEPWCEVALSIRSESWSEEDLIPAMDRLYRFARALLNDGALRKINEGRARLVSEIQYERDAPRRARIERISEK